MTYYTKTESYDQQSTLIIESLITTTFCKISCSIWTFSPSPHTFQNIHILMTMHYDFLGRKIAILQHFDLYELNYCRLEAFKMLWKQNSAEYYAVYSTDVFIWGLGSWHLKQQCFQIPIVSSFVLITIIMTKAFTAFAYTMI